MFYRDYAAETPSRLNSGQFGTQTAQGDILNILKYELLMFLNELNA